MWKSLRDRDSKYYDILLSEFNSEIKACNNKPESIERN